MAKPWSGIVPKNEWDHYAVAVPIFIISGVSFFHITRFAFEKGQNLDTFDTIERIKKKRKNSQEN